MTPDGPALAVPTLPMAPDAPVGLLVALAVGGIVLAAVLSAGEAALSRLTRAAAAEQAAAGGTRAHAVVRLAEHPARAIDAASFVRVFAEGVAAVGITLVVAASLSAWWHVLLVSVATTTAVLALVIGASPRGIGHRRPAAVLRVLGPGLLGLSTLAVPLERAGAWLRSGRTRKEEADDAAGELREMVDRVSESEQIEEDEREMLQSVFELGRTLTREVMVPRTAMVTVAADATLAQALRLFVRSGFSRIPVLAGSPDDVVGILYLKDVVRRLEAHPEEAGAAVAGLAREAAFVPETKPVDDLMREMQRSANLIALAVDEFGGIAGLVTIEDCVEEIVGEVRDEHDKAEPAVEDLGDGVVRVPARLPIDDLGEIFGLVLHDDEVDSAGGLLAKALGKVPVAGSVATVEGLRIEAESTEGRRRQVATLLVRRSEAPIPETNGGGAGTPAPARPAAGEDRA